MSLKLIDKDGLPFVANWNGTTVKISLPAITGNEWGSKSVFLDFPFMEPEVLDLYISALQEIRDFCRT